MTTTPVLGANDLVSGQAIPESTVNENSRRGEQGAQYFNVLDKDLAAAPGSPTAGDAYIIAAGPTGAWAGQAKSIAYYQAGTGWLFIAPRTGFRAYVQDEAADYRYSAGAWAIITAGATGGLLAANNLSDVSSVATARTNLSVYSQAQTDAAITTAVTGLLDYKGTTDCSANPNYPAALKGDAYVISVAGKIGGAAGQTVEPGDFVFAKADNAGGTEASVGASWDILQFNLLASLTGAADTDVWTGTSIAKGLTPKALFDAAKFQTLTDGATVTPDFGVGLNFKLTIGGNRTLANPTNAKEGQSGVIKVKQDATGTRTLAYGSNWRFPGGAATGAVLSTAANALDVITYVIDETGLVIAALTKGLAA